MVRRRRSTGNARKSQPQKKRSTKRPAGKKAGKGLKERLLTTGIWGLSLINIGLIFSLISNFFASPNEAPTSAGLPRTVLEEPQNERITVEVLNACGVQGLANEVTQFLRDKNFDVVNVGNYAQGFNMENTFVFDRVSMDGKYAQKVASALDLSQDHVVPQIDNSMQLKVSVIVGKDYKSLKLFAGKR